MTDTWPSPCFLLISLFFALWMCAGVPQMVGLIREHVTYRYNIVGSLEPAVNRFICFVTRAESELHEDV
jgi:hypothetical protein